MEIWAANELRWQGDLLPQNEISKRTFPEQDGYILVKGTWQGKRIESPKFGYLTQNIGGLHELILKSDGEFEYKQ